MTLALAVVALLLSVALGVAVRAAVSRRRRPSIADRT